MVEWPFVDPAEKEADAALEVRRCQLEAGVRFRVAARFGGGIRNAPVDRFRIARELGADLAHAVTKG
jgi:hypothetical protein